jgi:PP-loop superfamily ATP-utilizing enzyme
MDALNADLNLLENLSKKISDLLYDNKFSEISEIDSQRKFLIIKIKENKTHESIIKQRIGKLVENNVALIEATEKKLHKLSKNHNKFDKRLKAYSFNK